MVVDKIFKMQATMFYIHNQLRFLLNPRCMFFTASFSNNIASSFPLLLPANLYAHLLHSF
jgi:hypothetical protein